MDTGDVLASLGVEGATAAAHALSLPAEAYGNDAQLEVMWAMKAYNHAEVYYNLISSVDPKLLKLTKSDEQIYTKFREAFPDLSIEVLDPELLKSADAKEKWRPFCNQFEGVVEDFNYGTLLRLDCQKDYTEVNTIFGVGAEHLSDGLKCSSERKHELFKLVLILTCQRHRMSFYMTLICYIYRYLYAISIGTPLPKSTIRSLPKAV
uniref:Protein PBDC1-like n=1 Tax=Sinocyclocheilus anshuiensis TaxID=1608454 RepID=A0A671QH66_9TELE